MATRPVYSTRFIIGETSTTVPTLSYTVPVGRVAVIRTVTAQKQAAATASNFQLSIDPAGSGPSCAVWFAAFPQTNTLASASLECNIVCGPGDQILAQRSSGGATQVTVSGFLLNDL